MKVKFSKRNALFLGLFAPLTLGISSTVFAQEDGMEKDVEEVVVLGSRRAARSASDSAVPVDVINGEDFVNQGDTDLSNLLKNVVPSYNVNTQPISDAATLVRPANLRGLAPDHTLVLVNGKRRHRAAVIYWLGNGVSDGAQGPDISPIPAIALKQVSVLRDGAAAQYGSDAIAGVMNFQLKDADDGATFEAKYGEFFEGDGATYNIAGNIGLPFTDDGFLNLSFEYGAADETNRSIQRNDAQNIIDAGNTAVANPAQVWGQPIIDDDIKLIYNMGVQIDDSKEFYAFGNYAQKTVEGGFYFRNPNTRSAVFSGDGGQTLLVGDVLDAQDGIVDGSAGCPVITITDHVPDPAALAQVMSDPNCFVFNELFPGGFTPRFGGDVTDIATTVGMKGELDSGLIWDLSASYGRSHVDFVISNTVNASLGPQTPTTFDPGAYEQLDKNLNFDISKGFEVASFYSDLNIAGGFEYRSETFEITQGDQASYEIGPYAQQGFSSASNGFPGFSPLAAGSFERSNYAAYVDFEADVTENLLLGLAFRFEDYEDFGSTANGKFSGRYSFNDNFALRGAYSTGFRAPTPGQSNAFNVSTEFDLAAMELVNNGTIPSTNPIALLRGGKPLEPEDSKNITFGAVMSLGPIDLTIDYFRIDLEDRLAISQLYFLEQDEIDDLIASGVTSAANLRNFRFFTNDFETKTSGVDIVATYSTEIGNGNTDFALAYNQTNTDVTNVGETIDAIRIRELEEGLPDTRWNISANHTIGNWKILARTSYYDGFFDSEDNQSYGDEFIVDAEISYAFENDMTLTFGAQNLFDEFPDENPNAAAGVGNLYSQFSPSGFGGGFYYIKLRYDL